MKNGDQGFSRRSFLKSSAMAAVGPMILPSGVLAQAGKPGANDKLVLGHIGVGGMGTQHLEYIAAKNDVVSAAVCDVDKNHLKRAVDITGGKAETYEDYRRLLERDDLDGVIIAAPDHWHGLMFVHACQAGKDIYCEKPLSKTIQEGDAMLKAAKEYKRVVQVGSQGRSQPEARPAYNYIQNGQIGDVKRVDCWHYPNPTGGDPCLNSAPPSELNWDMWLGPAQWHKYNPDAVHFNFRWMFDFGGGQIRDRGCHTLAVMSWLLDMDGVEPVRVTAEGTPPPKGLWNCPPDLSATWEFDDGLVVTWQQPGPDPIDDWFGAVYHGSKEDLIVFGGDGGIHTEEKAINYTPPAKGKHAFESPGHHEDWFNAIKTREKPHMPIEAGHAVAVMAILANMSYALGRPLEWDRKKRRVVGDDTANLLLGMPGRGEWVL